MHGKFCEMIERPRADPDQKIFEPRGSFHASPRNKTARDNNIGSSLKFLVHAVNDSGIKKIIGWEHEHRLCLALLKSRHNCAVNSSALVLHRYNTNPFRRSFPETRERC